MLEPNIRQALLEALRPPDGFTLDFALGTTYSLDLPALLMVPLAFTFFDIADNEQGPGGDPVALLEAIRRNSNRIAVFVQGGQIKVPVKKNQLLYAELEKSVHAVQPANSNAVFHPKVWVMRFTHDKEVMYRLLCSSRNLTLDRSWDTLLCTEGLLTDRERPYSSFHGLGNLIKELPKLATQELPPDLKARIRQFEREVRLTNFEVPDGFERMHFWASGVAGDSGFCLDDLPRRLLVISPFVDDKLLTFLTKESEESILISRQEELQRLAPKTIAAFSKVHFLNQEAETREAPEENTVEELEGLHAKLFIAEYGWDAWVISGSTNATEAAFNRNVEFQVALQGKKSLTGIDAFLAREKNQVRFADMLSEFHLDEEALQRDREQEALDREADLICRLIAGLRFEGKAQASSDKTNFDLSLQLTAETIPFKCKLAKLVCWPITLAQEHGKPFESKPGVTAEFKNISFEALTSFFGFEVNIIRAGKQARRRFVVNVPVIGFPENRSERILQCMIKGADDLLRLILLILGENASWEERLTAFNCLDSESWKRSGFEAHGLFESLVRSLLHQPWKLNHINRIITDLRATQDGRQLIPEGFDAIWDPIWESRKALPNE